MADLIKQLLLPGYDLSKEQAIQGAIAKILRLTAEFERLQAKIEAMEQQEPAGVVELMPGASGFTMACFSSDEVPVGTKLYLAPGAKGE